MNSHDCDDSPAVSDIILCADGCSYQKVLKCILNDNFELSVDEIYAAFYDIIRCDDQEKANCLDYFLSSSLPSQFTEDKDPLAVLVAKQPDQPQLYDMLMILKLYDPDLLEIPNMDGETANSILDRNHKAIKKAIEHKSSRYYYHDFT